MASSHAESAPRPSRRSFLPARSARFATGRSAGGPALLALTVVMAASVPVPGVAADDEATTADNAVPELDSITIYALPLGSDSAYTPASFDLLEGQELFERSDATLGTTLEGLPGVHADTFGGGSSRPVIRGQTAPRVSVLSDGATLFDASAVSPDHAVTTDPLLAHRIEVLRGPSTLLYGGGAIGGVVNILDDKIPTRMPEDGADGVAVLRGNTVADERAGALGVTARATEHLALRLEGSLRDAEDYEVNGFTVPTIEGTFAESRTGTLGASWIGERGHIGIAFTDRTDEYGLPGHSHAFEGCMADGTTLDCGESGHDHDHDHDHDHGGHAAPYVDLDDQRIDVRGEYRDPLPGIERVRVRWSRGDYQHTENEAGVVGTTFRHKGYEARVELEHAPLAGWRGVVGAQYSDAQFNTLGLESFMPKTDTRIVGLFAVERYRINERWRAEIGARIERQDLDTSEDPRNRPAFDDFATSASAGLIWQVRPAYQLALTLSRAQRLPNAQEVYARGVHLATNTYECGLIGGAFTCGGAEGGVDPETSHNIGVNFRKTRGDLTFDAGAFYNRINDYVYARTLDQLEEFRLIRYTQDDAAFLGGEFELSYRWNALLSTTLFGDVVRGRLTGNDDDLPRIPADRLGMRVDGRWRAFDASAEVYRVRDQTNFAAFESETPGHTMLNASLTYHLDPARRYSVFLRGSNLLGEEVWNHTSFLARTVPEPGRNVVAGVRAQF